jgi:hypothetical protein
MQPWRRSTFVLARGIAIPPVSRYVRHGRVVIFLRAMCFSSRESNRRPLAWRGHLAADARARDQDAVAKHVHGLLRNAHEHVTGPLGEISDATSIAASASRVCRRALSVEGRLLHRDRSGQDRGGDGGMVGPFMSYPKERSVIKTEAAVFRVGPRLTPTANQLACQMWVNWCQARFVGDKAYASRPSSSRNARRA